MPVDSTTLQEALVAAGINATSEISIAIAKDASLKQVILEKARAVYHTMKEIDELVAYTNNPEAKRTAIQTRITNWGNLFSLQPAYVPRPTAVILSEGNDE